MDGMVGGIPPSSTGILCFGRRGKRADPLLPQRHKIRSESNLPVWSYGDCRFQKTFIQDPISHKSVPKRGELPQFLAEDCLLAIGDKETWIVAQEVLKRHTHEIKPPCKEHPTSLFKRRAGQGNCSSSIA